MKRCRRQWRFILAQQAQFTADIQQLGESQAKTEGSVSRLTEVVARPAAATMEGFKDINAKLLEALVDARIGNEENISKTGEVVRNLTAVVDRYFRERHGQENSG